MIGLIYFINFWVGSVNKIDFGGSNLKDLPAPHKIIDLRCYIHNICSFFISYANGTNIYISNINNVLTKIMKQKLVMHA